MKEIPNGKIIVGQTSGLRSKYPRKELNSLTKKFMYLNHRSMPRLRITESQNSIRFLPSPDEAILFNRKKSAITDPSIRNTKTGAPHE
jgi:hypothetical protein